MAESRKNARIAFRTTQAVKDVAAQLAEADNRTLSQWLEILVMKAAEQTSPAGE